MIKELGRRQQQVDAVIGARLRAARLNNGHTIAEMSRLAEVPEADIEAYEAGARRMEASTLYDFARLLQQPISFFFDDV